MMVLEDWRFQPNRIDHYSESKRTTTDQIMLLVRSDVNHYFWETEAHMRISVQTIIKGGAQSSKKGSGNNYGFLNINFRSSRGA
jgi:hypothetical protein